MAEWSPDPDAWKGEEGECGSECDAGLTLVLPFLDNSAGFVHGWEACSLWQRMLTGEPVIEGYFHAANDEMLLMMAARLGYTAHLEPYAQAQEWSRMRFVYGEAFT